jgi:hypothetical protein
MQAALEQAETEHTLYADRKWSTSSPPVDERPWTEEDFLFEERMRAIRADHGWEERMKTMHEIYARYRLVEGLRKFKPEDTGTEVHYAQWPNTTFEEGDWSDDSNNQSCTERNLRARRKHTMVSVDTSQAYISPRGHTQLVGQTPATCTQARMQSRDI